jgi:hypothetical protein
MDFFRKFVDRNDFEGEGYFKQPFQNDYIYYRRFTHFFCLVIPKEGECRWCYNAFPVAADKLLASDKKEFGEAVQAVCEFAIKDK